MNELSGLDITLIHNLSLKSIDDMLDNLRLLGRDRTLVGFALTVEANIRRGTCAPLTFEQYKLGL